MSEKDLDLLYSSSDDEIGETETRQKQQQRQDVGGKDLLLQQLRVKNSDVVDVDANVDDISSSSIGSEREREHDRTRNPKHDHRGGDARKPIELIDLIDNTTDDDESDIASANATANSTATVDIARSISIPSLTTISTRNGGRTDTVRQGATITAAVAKRRRRSSNPAEEGVSSTSLSLSAREAAAALGEQHSYSFADSEQNQQEINDSDVDVDSQHAAAAATCAAYNVDSDDPELDDPNNHSRYQNHHRRHARQRSLRVLQDESKSQSRSLQFLRNHCWGCHLWIHHPMFSTNTNTISTTSGTNNNDEICHSALHLHPVLQVPVCIICADDIEAVERERTATAIITHQRRQQKQKEEEEQQQQENQHHQQKQQQKRDEQNNARSNKKQQQQACSACGKLQLGRDENEGVDEVDFWAPPCTICSRAVCPKCFQQAHHGIVMDMNMNLVEQDRYRVESGSAPRKTTCTLTRNSRQQQRQYNNHNNNPHCICCPCVLETEDNNKDDTSNKKKKKKQSSDDDGYKKNLPTLLQKLRKVTLELFSERLIKSSSSSKSSSAFASHRHRQSLEDALDELQYLETEKLSCESKLENEEDLLDEIREELVGEMDMTELDMDIDEEGDRFLVMEKRVGEAHNEWIDHQTRLLDRIAILEDILKSEYGIEAHAAFLFLRRQDGNNNGNRNQAKENRKHKKKMGGEESSDDDDIEEPSWKISADKAIEKRIKAERKALKKEERACKDKGKGKGQGPCNGYHHPRFDLDITEDAEDAEDLGSSEAENDHDKGNDKNDGEESESENSDYNEVPDSFDLGWRNFPARASKEEIEKARTAEDIRRVEEGKARLIVRRKQADREEIKNWDAGLKSTILRNNNGEGKNDDKSKKKRKSLPTKTISLVANYSNSNTNNNNGRRSTSALFQSSATRRRTRDEIKVKDDNDASNRSKTATPGDEDENNNDSLNIIHTIVGRSKRDGFQPSSLVLSKDPLITIDNRLEKHLKQHQKEGINFMFRSSFADLGGGDDDHGNNENNTTKNTKAKDDQKKTPIGGCILAHSMGLGKSLSCISLLHAIMLQPSLIDSRTGRGRIHKVLLVVPVNTIANWEIEFNKWTKGMRKRLIIFNVSDAETHARHGVVEKWSDWGGVLLTSDALFRNMVKIEKIEKLLEDADAVILDESHTMLKNKDNLVYKAFMKIKTRRRICLTGTPFQNNLLEYYRMISYIRPNLLGNSEKRFQKEYSDPIQDGMGTDAAEDIKVLADKQLESFFEKLKPFVHRRDASLLLKDLPSLQQVCLHLRPTKLQRALYRAYNEHKKTTNDNNFFKQFVSLRSVHNHPGTLLFQTERPKTLQGNNEHVARKISTSEDRKEMHLVDRKISQALTPLKTSPSDDGETTKNKSGRESPDSVITIRSSSDEEDSDEYESGGDNVNEWWTKVAKKFGTENMKDVENGNKCIALLHILAHANKLGEKTVVFSQSLKVRITS